MINDLIRPSLREFEPYDSFVAAGSVCLNANENPYSLDDDEDLRINRYPEGQPAKLVSLLSDLYKAETGELVVTSGADQAIDLLVRVFIDAGDTVITTPPTFSMYGFYTAVQGGKVCEVPLQAADGYSVDVDGIIAAQRQTGAKLVFISNPSAPLGHIQEKNRIVSVLDALRDKAMVIVDEAYIEFSDLASFTALRSSYPNLVVLRTLSKYYGFAGLRLGSLIAEKEVADKVRAIAPPYSLSSASIKIAERLLSDPDTLARAAANKKRIISMRGETEKFLSSLLYVKKVFPTATNYVFFTVDDADALKSFCAEHNYMIRSFASSFPGGIRLSIGSEKQMADLFALLRSYKK